MTRTTLLEYVSVSTHSRPKAAGVHFLRLPNSDYVFQHTAARRRLAEDDKVSEICNTFQHTAARRRLDLPGLHV